MSDLVALLDYEAGNLASVYKALRHCGAEVVITAHPEALTEAAGVVLPGVGAFGEAMDSLRQRGLTEPLRQYLSEDRPFLGICLGLQLLFDTSEESPQTEGLGILRGKAVRFPDTPGLKVPHMGWNQLHKAGDPRALRGVSDGAYAYFVHSYCVVPQDEALIATTTDYGLEFVSSVSRGRLFACQFHPEKSQQVGLNILRNFLSLRD